MRIPDIKKCTGCHEKIDFRKHYKTLLYEKYTQETEGGEWVSRRLTAGPGGPVGKNFEVKRERFDLRRKKMS